MYLFDTDTVSNLMKRSPLDRLLSRIRSISVEDQFTSSITLGELIYGARKKGSARLLIEIQQLVTANLPVLAFDAEAARRYGELRAELEGQGAKIGDADMRIASIALARGLTVITGNVVEQGPTETIFEHPRDAYTKRLLAVSLDLDSVSEGNDGD